MVRMGVAHLWMGRVALIKDIAVQRNTPATCAIICARLTDQQWEWQSISRLTKDCVEVDNALAKMVAAANLLDRVAKCLMDCKAVHHLRMPRAALMGHMLALLTPLVTLFMGCVSTF